MKGAVCFVYALVGVEYTNTQNFSRIDSLSTVWVPAIRRCILSALKRKAWK
jgi:hypothetical protein